MDMRSKSSVVGLSLATLVSALALVRGARAEITIDQISPKLSVTGSVRARWELWNWFEPHGTQNNDYDFIGSVARLGVQWRDDLFDVVVEGQNSALIDLPTTAIAPAPEGNLGLGANYFQHNNARNDASVFLKQGYLTLKRTGIPGLTIKGGRFEFSEGNEVLTGNPTLDWLKNLRLSQRLIGPFSFSDVGRSFDGGVVAFTSAPYNVTLMASHPTQGGFDLNGMHEIDDIDLAYAGFNLTTPSWLEHADARVFYIYYDDRRHQVKTDNRPLPVRQGADRSADVLIHTEGAHFIYAHPTSNGPIDLLLWGAIQQGDWGLLDHSAWACDAELGWQPKDAPGKPWLRIGYSRTSGDNNPSDDDHGTFFQILPTARLYSYSTFYNLMNNDDLFTQIIFRPISGLLSRTDFHILRADESHDLWYTGSGATLGDSNRAYGFGYAGRPVNGQRELFTVVETTLSYDWNRYLNTNLYYAHFFGGAVIDRIYAASDADFGYLETTVRF
jgi:hypothetical protein